MHSLYTPSRPFLYMWGCGGRLFQYLYPLDPLLIPSRINVHVCSTRKVHPHECDYWFELVVVADLVRVSRNEGLGGGCRGERAKRVEKNGERQKVLDAIYSCLRLIATCLQFETTDHSGGGRGQGVSYAWQKGFLFGRVIVYSRARVYLFSPPPPSTCASITKAKLIAVEWKNNGKPREK